MRQAKLLRNIRLGVKTLLLHKLLGRSVIDQFRAVRPEAVLPQTLPSSTAAFWS